MSSERERPLNNGQLKAVKDVDRLVNEVARPALIRKGRRAATMVLGMSLPDLSPTEKNLALVEAVIRLARYAVKPTP